MAVPNLVRKVVRSSFDAAGFEIRRKQPPPQLAPPPRKPVFDSDELTVWGKVTPFFDDPRFMSAYSRGVNSGQRYAGPPNTDPHVEWRVYTTCWIGLHCSKLEGDFVECGVNTGMQALALCDYVDFNSTGKKFFLFDTYKGIPEDQMSERERPDRMMFADVAMYPECYEQAKANFAHIKNAVLVRGKVPETFKDVEIGKVAYLSLDMNIAYPERKAIEYIWPKMVHGAMVVLDDYGWLGYDAQKNAMDEFAKSVGVEILTLPTGQGFIVKP